MIVVFQIEDKFVGGISGIDVVRSVRLLHISSTIGRKMGLRSSPVVSIAT